MKKIILTTMCIGLMANTMWGQIDIIPPSPDASALGKYGDFPVSLATGLVDITIPLFEIGTKRVKLPIALSYHASGITVDEIASSVGLGWTLNAGGCIAISVKGKPDDINNRYTTNDIDAITDNGQKLETLYLLSQTSYADKESDIYSYNFNGYCGQFYTNNKQQIVSLAKDGLKIEKLTNIYNDYITGYYITTPDGIQYQFETEEVAYLLPDAHFNNTYYLSKIKDLANQEEIIFTYVTQVIPVNKVNTHYPYFNGLQMLPPITSPSFAPDIMPSFMQITRYKILVLSEITFPNGKIKIGNSNDRQDMGICRVENIKLYSNQNISQAVKTVNLEHSYFLSDAINNYYIGSDTIKLKRLRLDGLSINNEQKYQLKYNVVKLPPYFSAGSFRTNAPSITVPNCFSQDEWGFYNAKPNKTLYKSLPYHLSQYIADRTTDTVAIKACSLEEIIYPTGGKTKFKFEANTYLTNYSKVGGLRIKQIFNYADKNDNQPVKTTLYEYSGGRLTSLYQNYQDWTNKQNYKYCVHSVTPCNAPDCTNPQWVDFTYYSTSPLVSNRFHNGTIVYYENVTETTLDNNNTKGQNRYFYDIDEPIYDLSPYIFYTNEGMPWGSTLHLYKKYMKVRNYRSGHLKKYQTGKMENGSFVLQQETINEYTIFGQQLDTIGLIIQSRVNETFVIGSCDAGSGPLHSISHVSANYHYFDIIAESGVKKLTKSTTKHYFDNDTLVYYETYNYNSNYLLSSKTLDSKSDVITTNYTYPFEIQAGQDTAILRKMTEKNILSNYVEKVTTLNNNKVIGGEYRKYNNVYLPEQIDLLKQDNFTICDLYSLTNSYAPIFGLKYPISGKSFTLYCPETIQIKTTGNGSVKIKDHNGNIVYTQTFITGHQEDIYLDSDNYSVTLTPILFSHPSVTISSKRINRLAGSNKLTPEIYYQYDNKGNVIETTSAGSQFKTAYLWGYKQQSPVAEIQGASYNQVVAAIQGGQTTINTIATSDTLSTSNLVKLDALRNSLPNALVTTYTYKPLVGVETITDPRGIKTTYKYDPFGRLETIKDENGNLIENYKYNYKTP